MSETRAAYTGEEYEFKGTLLRDGFAPIPHTLIRTERLSGNQKVLLFLLMSRADRNGDSWEGQEAMARKVGVSLRTLQTLLSSLREKGIAEWARRGLGKTNLYTINQKGIEDFIEAESAQSGHATDAYWIRNPDVSGHAPVAYKEDPDEEEPKKNIRPKEITKERVTRKEVDEEFRGKMRQKYQAALGDQVDFQIDLALAHKAAKNYSHPQLYVQNWLNQTVKRDRKGATNGIPETNPLSPNYKRIVYNPGDPDVVGLGR